MGSISFTCIFICLKKKCSSISTQKLAGVNLLLNQGCPTFSLVRATFTGEKLLRATCIFAKIKLQIIASLLYKIGAHFSQYFEYLSPQVSEDEKKGLRRKSVLISVSISAICPKKKVKTKNKVLAATSN